MKYLFVMIFTLFLFTGLASHGNGEDILKMSTTTSTENSGLLGVLLPHFENKYKVRIYVIAVGTGQALKLGERGDVDIVFVHARELEDKFIADGYGIDRRDVMYNDFIIVGPHEDSAKIRGVRSAVEAFRRISISNAVFISRGDKSGTHVKELEIWKSAGIKPSGKWYIESGKGMGEVLNMAQEKIAYTLSDRGTYLAYGKKIELKILLEEDPILFNPYGIIAVNPLKHPHVNYKKAGEFIDWVTSREGQYIIANFKDKYGNLLFVPNAR